MLYVFLVAILVAGTAGADAYALGVEVRDSEGNLIGTGGESAGSNPLEPGVWFYPIIVSNVATVVIMVTRRNLFSRARGSARRILDFEIGPKFAFAFLSAILAVFTLLAVDDLSKEETWADYALIEHDTKDWNWVNMDLVGDQYMRVVKFFFISLSFQIFGNPRVIPYIATMALLIVVYFFTKEITKKRISGIVAAAIATSSNILVLYGASATYDQIYLLFYILSLYLIVKTWQLSPVSYILSLFSKPLAGVFLPLTFFFMYQCECSKRIKTRLFIIYGALLATGLVAIAMLGFVSAGFYPEKAADSVRQLPILLRLDGPIIFMFAIPVILGLYLKARDRVRYAEFLMFSMLLTLAFPILYLLFSGSVNESHNMVPLLLFFAISVGVLLSENKQQPSYPVVTRTVFILAMGVATITVISGLFPQLTLVP